MRMERVSSPRELRDPLPAGVACRPLKTYPDERGDFTEFFRNEWQGSPLPVQWNISRSRPNVLRGVHVHARHWDYLCVVEGTMTIGLRDMRSDALAARQSATLQLNGDVLEVLAIPPGVAHGFYSISHSTYVIGASSYYDPTDHRRCRWDCPELDIRWPCAEPELSPADRDAPAYSELAAAFRAAAASVRSGT
ncbi:MAG TPA: dTDP-4-dehydrorhamnose 3,5-epimerase family protein [Dongiaceae bacterium]|nr:dTDP-4-dehydrorhamnose 3,5-epimerase family protein [Dongiaceae bacterium]